MFLCAVFVPAQAARADSVSYPLDGLTGPELWAVSDALRSSGHVDTDTRYPFITLHEPLKAEVLQWKPGQSFRREALVIVKQGPKTFEAIVDIPNKKVVSWRELTGIQPNVTNEEVVGMNDALHADSDWQAAMGRRGITNYSAVSCVGASPGYFGTAEEQGRRLLRVGCFERRNTYEPDSRPIEGIVIVWDVDNQKVIRVIDLGVVPVPRTSANYDMASVHPLRKIPTPITVQQPLGPSFTVEGSQVDWQNWNFHFRIDRRVGLILSNVRYADSGKMRSILYEASLSEVFVPYMDPEETWYWATYLDAGEFANGFSTPLDPGTDCPDNAVYFDQVYADETGLPWVVPRAACLFERSAGDIAWRHIGSADPVESRKRRDLVLRTIANFENYDYIFDWVFRQDGSIQVLVGATGINEFEAVVPKTAADDPSGAAQAYGRFVAENTVAPYHDHYFSFRLDFDLDGTGNSFVVDRLRTERVSAGTPRKSIWVATPEVAHTESEAKLRVSAEQPELWRVINPNVKNAIGYPVSYEIVPGETARPLLLPQDYPQRRAGFTDYQLWVTPYSPDERYAAGDFPTQSKGGDGLPSWTRANRPIENTDIVVWYTMGFHHVPRAEDFPVMPTTTLEFELFPFNFFSRNPAIDLPRQP